MEKNIKTTLPKITSKQQQILLYLYQFRFLHTNLLQLLLKHKNPRKIQIWLKDLKEKGYIKRYTYANTFENHTKPAVYFLSLKARKMLKTEKDCNIKALNKLYKESARKKSFVDHCISVANIYLFFLSDKKIHEELHFFTESQLSIYNYFPHQLISAYVAIKTQEKTKRYFLALFKDSATAGVLRFSINAYINYFMSNLWQENANNQSFPIVLFVCPNENLKKHISYFAKAVFEKIYEDKFSLYLTTKQKILQENPMWEKI